MTLLRAAAVAAAYFATAWIGLAVHSDASVAITLIWPPVGVGLAATRVWGPKMLAGVAIAAYAVNAVLGAADPAAALVIAVGNTGAIALTAWILVRAGQPPDPIAVTRHLRRLAVAAAIGCLVSATVGAATLAATGHLSASFAIAWLSWWIGDTMGMLMFEPPLLVLLRAGE